MMAQPRARKASWRSSRISRRVRGRRNQCGSAKAASTTERWTPRPEPARSAASDDRSDAQFAAVGVVLVAAAGVQSGRASAGTPALASDGRHGLDQGYELGDVGFQGGQLVRERGRAPAVDVMDHALPFTFTRHHRPPGSARWRLRGKPVCHDGGHVHTADRPELVGGEPHRILGRLDALPFRHPSGHTDEMAPLRNVRS